MNFDDFPWTPHSAAWEPQQDSVRSIGGYEPTYGATYPAAAVVGAANDGKDPSTEIDGGTIACFIEEKSARWVVEKYGVETERRPYLFIAKPSDVTGMQAGDTIRYNDQPLTVVYAPKVYDVGDGLTHAETMLTGAKTGGRGL